MTIPSTIDFASAATRWDVIVIGAGPAGATAACLAARDGGGRNKARVLLVDRGEFPRDKVCGSCVNARALASLRNAGHLHSTHRIAQWWRIEHSFHENQGDTPMKTLAAAIAVALLGSLLAAAPNPVEPDPHTPRPIAARDSVWIEELTWMEIRDAMQAGKDTVIIATGGIEQNGPYLALDKHNIILRGTAERIARRLGDALVAPIVPFVPEGDIDPPSLHMKYPGSISVTEDTYRRLLTDICASFRAHGFRHIVLIGDSGGNQDGLKHVAETLSAEWSDGGPRVHYVPEYYDYAALKGWLEEQGVKQIDEGIHDDFAITALMMAVDPASVRTEERIAAGKFRINGIDLAPAEKTIEWGRKIAEHRAEKTERAIRAARGK